VAELLVRVRQANSLCSIKFVNLTNTVMTFIFLANYAAAIGLYWRTKDGGAERMVNVWLPFLFIMIDSLVLLYAVVRVRRVLKNERMKALSNVQMGFHVSLLFLLSAVQGLFFIGNSQDLHEPFWQGSRYFATTYNVGDTVVSCMIAFIVWSVDSRYARVNEITEGLLNYSENLPEEEAYEESMSHERLTETSIDSFLEEVAYEDPFAARTFAHSTAESGIDPHEDDSYTRPSIVISDAGASMAFVRE
jgi:hypothetical protein